MAYPWEQKRQSREAYPWETGKTVTSAPNQMKTTPIQQETAPPEPAGQQDDLSNLWETIKTSYKRNRNAQAAFVTGFAATVPMLYDLGKNTVKNHQMLREPRNQLGEVQSSLQAGVRSGETVANSQEYQKLLEEYRQANQAFQAVKQEGEQSAAYRQRKAAMEEAYRRYDEYTKNAQKNAAKKAQNPEFVKLAEQLEQAEASAPAVSPDSLGMRMFDKAREFRRNASEGLGPVGTFLTDTTLGIAESAAAAATGILNPAAPLAIMGAKATAERGYELSKEGVSAQEALGRGMISGAIEALTEKIPLDDLIGIIGKGGKNVVRNILRQAKIEATEESVSYFLNYLADKAAGDPNAEFSLEELGMSALGGGVSGAIFGAAGSAIGKLNNRNQTADGDARAKVENENTAAADAAAADVATEKTVVNDDFILKDTGNREERAQDSKKVLSKLKTEIPNLKDMEPVYQLIGDEFSKSNKKLTEQVGEFFKRFGEKVYRRGLGNVTINERGVRIDMSHGIGRAKAATFAAVPSVIQNGRQIDFQENWKGRGYDSYVFAAPVKIGQNTDYVAVVVHRNRTENRFYLHEVLDENGNIIFLNKKEDPGHIKNGVTARGGITVGPESSTTSIAEPTQKVNIDVANPMDQNTGNHTENQPETADAGNLAQQEADGNGSRKVVQYRRRGESAFLSRIGRILSLPMTDRSGRVKQNVQKQIQPALDLVAKEYSQTGKVSKASRDALFEAAYANGLIVMDEYYQTYRPVREELRGKALTISKEDASSLVGGYDDFKKTYRDILLLKEKGGTPVETEYMELSERFPELFPEEITHPADQLQHIADTVRGIAETQISLSEYYGEGEAEYKAWARENFNTALEQLLDQYAIIKRYQDGKAAVDSQTDVKLDVEEWKEQSRKVEQLQKQYDQLMRKSLISEADRGTVNDIARGVLDPEQIPKGRINRESIIRIGLAKKALTEARQPMADAKRNYRESLRAEAEELIDSTVDSWKDKKTGVQYYRETAERNILDIIPDREAAEKVIEQYFTPVHRNEAESNRMKNEYRSRVRALGISEKQEYELPLDKMFEHDVARRRFADSHGYQGRELPQKVKVSEAELVQLYGEKMITAEMVRESGADIGKIRTAALLFRDIYDELHGKLNEVYVRNGYDPINKREDYFPHYVDDSRTLAQRMLGKVDNLFTRNTLVQKIAAMAGPKWQDGNLPTSINGTTSGRRPGRAWLGNILPRTSDITDYNALKGFDSYLESAADVIWHTDDIQRLRALEDVIRKRYDPKGADGTQQQIDRIVDDLNLSQEEKRAWIEEIYNGTDSVGGKKKKDLTHLNRFVVWLREYTNTLANKKNDMDRTWEYSLGRGIYTASKAVQGRVAANMVAVNPGSWLTNFIPISQALGGVKTTNMLRAMRDTVKTPMGDDGLKAKSAFLTNRSGSDSLSKTATQQVSDMLSYPMTAIDEFTAESIVRARYYENVQDGMSEEAAIADADRFAAGVMADRSKGSMPLYHEMKSPMMKVITAFQLEVNNQLSYLFKDIPRDRKNQILMAVVMAYAKVFVSSWIYNNFYEMLTGRRSALDPIDIVAETIGDISEGKDGSEIVGNLSQNILQEAPVASSVLGGGRFPVMSAAPDLAKLSKVLDGDISAGRKAEIVWEAVEDPVSLLAPPVGGGQIRKTLQGAKALIDGGYYTKNDNGEKTLQYRVERTPGNIAKGLAFGRSALKEAQDWVDRGFTPEMSKSQVAKMQEAKQYGITYDEYIDAYQKVKRSFAEHPQMVGDRKGAIFSAIEGLPLSAEKKNVLYNFLKDVQPSDLTGKELNEYLKASGIKPELYEELAGEAARLKDIRDSTGAVSTRRKEQLFGLIEAQKLTAKQKEVLWNLLG